MTLTQIASFSAALFLADQVAAQNVVVTSLASGVDPNDGVTTLEEAIIATEADAAEGTITFSPALDGQTMFVDLNELTISRTLTIDGDHNGDGVPDLLAQFDETPKQANTQLRVTSTGNFTLKNFALPYVEFLYERIFARNEGGTVTLDNVGIGAVSGPSLGCLVYQTDGTLNVLNCRIGRPSPLFNLPFYGIFPGTNAEAASLFYLGDGFIEIDGSQFRGPTSPQYSRSMGTVLGQDQGRSEIRNSTFERFSNEASAAIYVNKGSLLVEHCLFKLIRTDSAFGGGVIGVVEAVIEMRDTEFSDFYIKDLNAGPVVTFGSGPPVNWPTIIDSAPNGVEPTVKPVCLFTRCRFDNAGTVYSLPSWFPEVFTVRDCVFRANTQEARDPFSILDGKPVVINSSFDGTRTVGQAIIINSTFLRCTGRPGDRHYNCLGADNDPSWSPLLCETSLMHPSVPLTDIFETGVLEGNGGPVETFALRADPNNPAIDAGNPLYLTEAYHGRDFNGDGDTDDAIQFDANGRSYFDVPGVGVSAVDLGAHEATQAPVPSMSPMGGTFTEPVEVSVSGDPTVSLSYTKDGETRPYAGPFHVVGDTLVEATASAPGFFPAKVEAEFSYRTPLERTRELLGYAHEGPVNDNGSGSDPNAQQETGAVSVLEGFAFNLVDHGPQNGLDYQYFELTDASSLDEIIHGVALQTGTIEDVSLPADRPRNENFGYQFDGFIRIDTGGWYTFWTASDDGSTLEIGDTLVVNNLYLQPYTSRSGNIYLEPGFYPIRVRYTQAGGGAGLEAAYQGPGFSAINLPNEVLYRRLPTALNQPQVLSDESVGGTPRAWIDQDQNEYVFQFLRRTTASRSGLRYELVGGTDLTALGPVSPSLYTVTPESPDWERVTMAWPLNTPRFFASVALEEVGRYTSDFAANGAQGVELRGDAVLTGDALQLTAAANDQMGVAVFKDALIGPEVRGFRASFHVAVGPGTAPPADGYGFAVGDLGDPTTLWGQNAPNTPHHLLVGFDTLDNTTNTQGDSISIWVDGALVSSVPADPYTSGQYVPVVITYHEDLGVTVRFNGQTVLENVAVPGFQLESGDQFGIGARTGAANQQCRMKDLVIEPL